MFVRTAFVETLAGLAKDNPKVFLITGDLGFGVLQEFAREFPAQFINAGVAEQNMTGLATGLALEGRVVFTYSIANFPTLRCLEQIRNDVCYHDANVKIVAVGGGFSYGSLGISHHATEDLAILRSLPQMTVVSPGDTWEVEEATRALARLPGPAYLRLDKSSAPRTHQPGEIFQLGKIRTVREGRDVTLACTGGILGVAMAAAQRLAQEGIESRVLSVHTVKPLDGETILKSAQETGGIVTVEEHTVEGGLGSLVAETCLENQAPPEFFYRVGLRAGFSSQVGSQNHLRDFYHMNISSVIQAVTRCLHSSKRTVYQT